MELLTPHQVRVNWPTLTSLLARAVKHNRGEIEVEDILELVEQGRMGVVVWRTNGVIDLAAAFEVNVFPRRKVVNFAYAGGRGITRLLHNRKDVERLVDVLGADAVQCSVRPTMKRLLTKLSPDVQQAYLVMEWVR